MKISEKFGYTPKQQHSLFIFADNQIVNFYSVLDTDVEQIGSVPTVVTSSNTNFLSEFTHYVENLLLRYDFKKVYLHSPLALGSKLKDVIPTSVEMIDTVVDSAHSTFRKIVDEINQAQLVDASHS